MEPANVTKLVNKSTQDPTDNHFAAGVSLSFPEQHHIVNVRHGLSCSRSPA
jgi:hypothetical protein